MKDEFTLWNSAYMERAASVEDADPEFRVQGDMTTDPNYYRGVVKHYA